MLPAAKVFSVLWKNTEVVPPEYHGLGACVIDPREGSVFYLETSDLEAVTNVSSLGRHHRFDIPVSDQK